MSDLLRRRRRTGPILVAGACAIAVLALYAAPAAGPVWSALILDIQQTQRALHRALTAGLTAVRADGAAAAWSLIGLSFLYGIFHAAGPGHGKVVISTYLLTQPSRLKRGIALSFGASLLQGVTAILAVTVTAGLLDLSLGRAKAAAAGLETTSFALIALIGFLLVASRLRRLARRIRGGHDHAAGDAGCGHEPGCGHAHAVPPDDKPTRWRDLLGLALSVGIRPCSGAVLVLLVAYAGGLIWAGVASVAAMALGTGITVAVLATLSVYARDLSRRLAGLLPDGGGRAALAADLVALTGGAVILAMGALLLQAALTQPAHPLA